MKKQIDIWWLRSYINSRVDGKVLTSSPVRLHIQTVIESQHFRSNTWTKQNKVSLAPEEEMLCVKPSRLRLRFLRTSAMLHHFTLTYITFHAFMYKNKLATLSFPIMRICLTLTKNDCTSIKAQLETQKLKQIWAQTHFLCVCVCELGPASACELKPSGLQQEETSAWTPAPFFSFTKQQKIQLLATTQLLSPQTQRLKSQVGFVD